MRKQILLFSMAFMGSIAAMGWGRLGHATIAQIAENHLTKTTQKAVAEIMHNESFVGYASFADDYKGSPCIAVDYGKEYGNGVQRVDAHPHTFEVNMDFKPFRGILDGDRQVKNCLYFIEKYSKQLKNYKRMDKQQAWYNLVLIVHFVGDMHCPEHMRFNPEDMTIGYYNVKLMGQEERYHTIWDGDVISVKWPWSFGDVAKLFDSFTDEEIEQVVTGDVYTWGEDAARSSWPIHQIKEGAVLKKKWLREQMPLVQKQIRNAGYRLAHILNMTFDTKYAKKYIVKQK